MDRRSAIAIGILKVARGACSEKTYKVVHVSNCHRLGTGVVPVGLYEEIFVSWVSAPPRQVLRWIGPMSVLAEHLVRFRETVAIGILRIDDTRAVRAGVSATALASCKFVFQHFTERVIIRIAIDA